MPSSDHIRDQRFRRRVPLWKSLLIIVLVIAMPLFFSLYRSYQLQRTIDSVSPQQASTTTVKAAR